MELTWFRRLRKGRNLVNSDMALKQIGSLMPGTFYRIEMEPGARIAYVADDIVTLLGYSARELMNANALTLMRARNPELEEIVSQKEQLCSQGREVKKLQYYLLTKTGSAIRVDDHFIGEYNDQGKLTAINGYIHETKTSSVKLQLLHQLEAYRTAIDVNIISSITDPHGTIIYANENFKKVSQYTDEELLGKNHRIIRSGYHPKSFFEQMWRTISSGKMWRGEILNRAKDGSYYWVNTVVIPVLDEYGKIGTYLSLRMLITDQKRAQQQRENYIHTLEEIANVVAHDLRGPVCTILGLAQLAEKSALNEEEFRTASRYLAEAAGKLDEITRALSAKIYAADRDMKEAPTNGSL